MAIYHLNGQMLSKVSKATGKPKSPLACAAYRSGEKLTDEKMDQSFYYEREIQPDSFILSPDHAPEWTQDREKLWNEVNVIEKNYNAQFAREFNIALPVELNHDQQKSLATSFCQEAFVDRGMVADVNIHRDDIDNPHFHVMLTVRPFNEDGSWGLKAKREYVLNEKGDHVLDKYGKKKFVKVNTVDWNSKESFSAWRELWANKANEFLEKNKINERITHLSNESIGTEKLPTVHEGFVARKMQKNGRESERVSYNEDVKKYNNKIESIQAFKEKKQAIHFENKFTRKFTPKEKAVLSHAAKELRFFVNSETLSERKLQLEKWKKAVTFKPDSENKYKALSRIETEEKAIEQAERVLENEANRFIKNYYKHWDVESLDYEEKVRLVDETLSQNDFLSDNEIDLLHMDVQSEKVQQELSNVLKNRWTFIVNVENHIELAGSKLKHLNTELGITNDNYVERIEALKDQSNPQINVLKDTSEKLVTLHEVKTLMTEFYDLEIARLQPDIDVSTLTIHEKELIVSSYEYYGESVDLDSDEFKKYSTEDQEKIIQVLNQPYKVKREIMANQFADFQWKNPIHLLLFKEECLTNPELSKESKMNILKISPEQVGEKNINQAIPLYEMNETLNHSGISQEINPQIAVQGLRNMMQGILKDRKQEGVAKKQFEDDLKRKKKKTKQRNQGHSL